MKRRKSPAWVPAVAVLLALIAVLYFSQRDPGGSESPESASSHRQGPADARDDAETQASEPARAGSPAALPAVRRVEVEDLDPAFTRVGAPSATRPFPRGPNGERRYREPQQRATSPESREARPVPFAMVPEDGRLFLRPGEENDGHSLASLRMALDVAALESVVAGETARLLAPTPDGGTLAIVIDKILDRSGMSFTLQGEVEGEPQTSVAQFVFHDGIVHGSVARFHLEQEIEYRILADGHLMVRELDQSTMRDVCGDPGLSPEAGNAVAESSPGEDERDEGAQAAGDTPGYVTVDVVVGYDKAARQADGGYAQIEARIIGSVDRMSLSFSNSQIQDTELMLLGTVEDPDYVFPGAVGGNMSSGDELGDLENGSSSNPNLNTVSDYATALGADLQAFVLKDADGSAGVAYLPGRSSIVARTYMTATRLTFVHELGHNFGARHSWGDTDGSDAVTTVHTYGWRLDPDGHPRVRTIMAYDWSWGSGVRIPYFGNPNVEYQGARTGQVNGYNASGDPRSDARYVSGGLVGGLGTGFNGSHPNLGARNAHHIYGSAPGRADLRTRTAFAVQSPATGASFGAGDLAEIHWTGGDYSDAVTVDLFKGGVHVETLASGLRGDQRRLPWTVPSGISSANDYMVRVTLNGALTADSGLFAIVGNDFGLTPLTGFESSGDAGGPFAPASKTYTLNNNSASAILWNAEADVPWLDLSPSSGSIPAGGDVSVTVSLNAQAPALPAGVHTATLSFINISTSFALTRPVALTVIGYPQITVAPFGGAPLAHGTATVDFGAVLPPVSATRRFTIGNAGSAPLVLGARTLIGPHASRFSLGTPTATTLAAGEIAQLDVVFSPDEPGPCAAVLAIASNDAATPAFEIALAGSSADLPAGVQLTADINSTSAGLSPTAMVSMDGYALFIGGDALHGRELWRSDGTLAGTHVVKDIVPGRNSSNPGNLTRVGNLAFFSAATPEYGTELWVTDGTGEGTRLVRDIQPGINSSSPTQLAAVGETLFFRATTQEHGAELWKSDGAEAGTVRVRDIRAGSASSSPANLIAMGETLFFTANDGVSGVELWKSDGAEAGTVRVRDINPGSASSSPAQLTAVGGILFFAANDGATGVELWKSDGAEVGTVRVRDIEPGSGASSPLALIEMGGILYFRATTSEAGYELWRSDGAEAGTHLVKDINRGTGNGLTSTPVVYDGKLYFSANDGSAGAELWTSDGTAEGTELLADIYSGASSSTPGNFRESQGLLFFSAFTQQGRELWKTDGAAAGTTLVRDISPGSGSSTPNYLTSAADLLLFFADDGASGRELWRSDGALAGTVPVGDLAPGTAPATIAQLTNVNGRLYFSGNDGVAGAELWTCDGAAGGARLVRDLNPGTSSSSPTNLTALGDLLIFSANPGTTGVEPHVSDGTAGGTLLLRDIRSGTGTSSPDQFAALGNRVFFRANDGALGLELWKTDGTPEGTVLVKDINPGSADSSPFDPVNYRGRLLFRATTAAEGAELWHSDGATAGTALLADIAPGDASSTPWKFRIMDGRLYFSGFTSAEGRELWVTDGAAAGTMLVADIRGGAGSATPDHLTALGNILCFTADDGIHGRELWITGGAAAGTALLLDIMPGPGSSGPAHLTVSGGYLYFTADDGVHGRELWRSDGTAAGTQMFRDILPGGAGSSPGDLVNMGGTLFFAADDGVHGRELWKSDGTAGGTVLAADLYLGVLGSEPQDLTATGPVLHFHANHPSTGTALFHLVESVPAKLTISHPAGSPLGGDTPLSFPPLDPGETMTRVLTLENHGTQRLAISGASLGGPDAGDFVLGPLSRDVLFGNDIATLDIVFAPQSPGLKTAALTLTSDDPEQPELAVQIVAENSPQEIDFPSIPNQIANGTLGLTATGGGSGNPVTFAVAVGPAVIDGANSLSFTGAGEVTVTANQQGNDRYHPAEPVSRTFTVSKAPATVTLTGLHQTYNGSPRTSGATTVPAGLTVAFAYDGSPSAPVNAGSYGVIGTINDAIYQGSASDTLVVAKASQGIVFPAIPDQFATATVLLSATGGGSGNPLAFSVTAGPGVIGGGNSLSFTGADEVTITATQGGDGNYEDAPPVDRTFSVSKAPATVTLTGLNQTYNGTPRTAGATTDPAGLTVPFTYDGSPDAPVNVGSYAVIGTINDAIFQGSASGTLVVAKAAQSIDFPAIPDQLAAATVLLSATGGGSGNPVLFAVTAGPGVIDVGNSLTFTGPGEVTVTADQAGDNNHEEAPSVARTFTVTPKTLTLADAAVAEKEYDGTRAAAITGTLTGVEGSDEVTLGGGGDFDNPNVGMGKPVTASLTLGGAQADKYQLAQPAGLTSDIVPKPVTAIADGQSKTYGEADPALTYASAGLIDGDSFKGSLARLPGETAGLYPIELGTLTAGANYRIDYTGADLVIGPRAISVVADPAGKYFEDPDPVLTYTVTGLIDGDGLTGALSREPGEDVGTYAIHLGTLSAGANYAIDFTPAVLSIMPHTPNSLYERWASRAGLSSGPARELTATPWHDGVANLVKYAFNLDGSRPDRGTLAPGSGRGGLPVLYAHGAGPSRVLRFEFLRRKGSGLIYEPQTSANLAPGSWTPLPGTPVVVDIDEDWERVFYEGSPTASPQFRRVKVTLPEPE